MKIVEELQHTLRSGKLEFGSEVTRQRYGLGRKRVHLRTLLIDLVMLVGGGLILAFAITLFIAPFNIAPGGSTGMAIVLTNYVDVPLGWTLLLFNIPFFFIGYRKLGGSSFLARSLIATVTYNVGIEVIQPFLPAQGITDVMILNAIFGGLIGGIGGGLIYRAGGTAGAGGVINRLLRQMFGWPVKYASLISNSFVMGLAGLVFGWEAAMYAVISFFVSGSTADFVLDGPDVVQAALIVTDRPDDVVEAVGNELDRGITRWPVENAYSRKPHTVLYSTVTRPEINRLKNAVAWADNNAFVIVMQGHEALGQGFRPISWRPPTVETLPDD